MLCPLLFLLFVNHLPTYVISKCTFFGDDVKTCLNIRHSNIVYDIAQFGSYYFRRLGLPFVGSCKNLGILFDTE